MQTKKTAPAAQEGAAKPQPTHVLAELEFKQFNPTTGERISKPFQQYYDPQEWEDLKAHGPRRGLFLIKVIEAPEGTDLEYKNPQ
jgi:hypothetical protein